MQTGYKIRHLPTGTLMQTPYQSMTEAMLALTMASPNAASEYDVIPVHVPERPPLPPRCGECDAVLMEVGEFLFCVKPSCSMYEREVRRDAAD